MKNKEKEGRKMNNTEEEGNTSWKIMKHRENKGKNNEKQRKIRKLIMKNREKIEKNTNRENEGKK